MPNRELAYEAIERHIEKESSVKTWSYVTQDGVTTVEIDFVDEEVALRIALNVNNLTELQTAIETIDNYFAAKNTRS